MDNEFKVWLSLICSVAAIVIIFWFCKLHFEVASYNRLTNPPVKATAWDAIWVQLRVINCKNKSSD